MNALLTSISPEELTGNRNDGKTSLCPIKRKPLAQALHVAGIKVFDPDSVKAYQAEFRTNFCRRIARYHTSMRQPEWFEKRATWLLVILGAIALTLLTEGLIAFGATLFAGVTISVAILARDWKRELNMVIEKEQAVIEARIDIRWRRYPFGDLLNEESRLVTMIGPAPKETLEVRSEIQARCPEAECFVEVFDDDPFLIVALGDEEYYAAVWGEDWFTRA